MICKDDRDLLNLFGHALKSKYNVISVGLGEECIERFIEEKNHGNKIHLLSLDYRLAVLPGYFLLVPPIHTYRSLRLILDLLRIQSEHRNLNHHQTLNPLGKLASVIPLLQLLVQLLLVVLLLLDLLVAVVVGVNDFISIAQLCGY
jgi:hypothetical protein